MRKAMHRRQWLQQALGWAMLPALPLAARAQATGNGAMPRFIAAWQDGAQQHIGQLAWTGCQRTSQSPGRRATHTMAPEASCSSACARVGTSSVCSGSSCGPAAVVAPVQASWPMCCA